MAETIQIVDAETLGAFFFTVELDGSTFQLSFQYNSREGYWYFDLLDDENTPIRQGVKCVINWPVIRLCREEGRPLGEVLIVDPKAEALDPTLQNLGVDGVLTYVPQAELP